jgi:hypothetical protein
MGLLVLLISLQSISVFDDIFDLWRELFPGSRDNKVGLLGAA